MLTPGQIKARDTVSDKLRDGRYHTIKRACPLCGMAWLMDLAREDRYGLPVSTVLCKECGLLQTNPVMREADYRDFYQHHYTDLYDAFQVSPAEFFTRQRYAGMRLERIVRPYLDLSNSVVAEVGCAAGGVLEVFRPYCRRVVGCDYDTPFLQYGRTRGLNLWVGNLTTISVENPSVLIYSHLLEHVYDVHRELDDIFDALPGGGHLIVEVPGLFNLAEAYQGDFQSYLQNAHLVHFTRSTLVRFLSAHGFAVRYADERCIAVAEKTFKTPYRPIAMPQDAARVLAFLATMRRWRWWYRLKTCPGRAARAVLKALNLMDMARQVRRWE